MTSSTSSSETDPGWGRSLLACLGTLIGAALLVLALMVAVDPYDSGKLGLLGIDTASTIGSPKSRPRAAPGIRISMLPSWAIRQRR
ncbi:hypothetical protein ACVWWP_002831 [Bradyrhizobium sp. LM3.6]